MEEPTRETDARWRLRALWPKIVAASLLILVGVLAYVSLQESGLWDRLANENQLREWLAEVGAAGPFLIVGLMTLAIVFSPLPSAPIALAAGAAYGHGWGTLYVALGAELGALVAFGLARILGQSALTRWLGELPPNSLLNRFMHSQNGLMLGVFATRLMPFLSFDVISYGAGLTPLATWRFAVATLAGIIPASFVLAHFGDELASGDLREAGITVLALGAITVLPLVWKGLPRRLRMRLVRVFPRGRSH